MQKRFNLSRLWRFALCLAAAAAVWPAGTYAQGEEAENAETTLSPYFFVETDDPTIDALPLKRTNVDISIAGVMARVRVTQVYENRGEKPLEAIYVFPGSTRAAVFAMRMRIGDRTIEANIRERERAQQEYEEAKEEGKSVTLLQQHRPNVFQMSVANIMPGDTIEVELDYVELLTPEDGVYEFVYPTVVGPRYSKTPAEDAPPEDEFVESPYLHEGDTGNIEFSIKASIQSGIPIKEVSSPSHQISVAMDEGATKAGVAAEEGAAAGTKDFILRYNLRGGEIETGGLLYAAEDEKFFLVMVEPPARVEEAEIPPREYQFVIDVSGSMRGFPLETSKAMMRRLLSRLRPSDRFNIITFAGASTVFYDEPLAAEAENIERAIADIDKLTGAGGTNLDDALARVFALPRHEEALARSCVVLTDGYVSFELEVFDLIRNNLRESNLFAFGIGSSVNRFLIEGMARAGMGEPFVVTKPEEAEASMERFANYIKEPVWSQLSVDYGGLDAYAIEPPSPPDVFTQRPVILFGKYRGEANATISVSGHTAAASGAKSVVLDPSMEDPANEALRYLWARHRIQTLSDYENLRRDEERKQEIVDLGLKYNLLTQYTSFIAVDTTVRNEGGESETVEQPLPLPEGVEDSAVGGGATTVNRFGIHLSRSAAPQLRKLQSLGYAGGMIISSATLAAEPQAADQADGIAAEAVVTGIEDGTTLRVMTGGRVVNIRLLCIEPPQPGTEARKAMMQWLRTRLLGQTIRLVLEEGESWPERPETVEAYAFLGGMNINAELARQGWAKYAPARPNHRFREQFAN